MLPGNTRDLSLGIRTDSAAENIPPFEIAEVRVKWCGKSAPAGWQQNVQGKPQQEQSQAVVFWSGTILRVDC